MPGPFCGAKLVFMHCARVNAIGVCPAGALVGGAAPGAGAAEGAAAMVFPIACAALAQGGPLNCGVKRLSRQNCFPGVSASGARHLLLKSQQFSKHWSLREHGLKVVKKPCCRRGGANALFSHVTGVSWGGSSPRATVATTATTSRR